MASETPVKNTSNQSSSQSLRKVLLSEEETQQRTKLMTRIKENGNKIIDGEPKMTTNDAKSSNVDEQNNANVSINVEHEEDDGKSSSNKRKRDESDESGRSQETKDNTASKESVNNEQNSQPTRKRRRRNVTLIVPATESTQETEKNAINVDADGKGTKTPISDDEVLEIPNPAGKKSKKSAKSATSKKKNAKKSNATSDSSPYSSNDEESASEGESKSEDEKPSSTSRRTRSSVKISPDVEEELKESETKVFTRSRRKRLNVALDESNKKKPASSSNSSDSESSDDSESEGSSSDEENYEEEDNEMISKKKKKAPKSKASSKKKGKKGKANEKKGKAKKEEEEKEKTGLSAFIGTTGAHTLSKKQSKKRQKMHEKQQAKEKKEKEEEEKVKAVSSGEVIPVVEDVATKAERYSAIVKEDYTCEGEVLAKDLKLRDFQIDGVKWLIQNYLKKQSCILGDEMGLGKTVQTIAFLNTIFHFEKKSPKDNIMALVIVPVSTVEHWNRELKKWGKKDLRVFILSGEQQERGEKVEKLKDLFKKKEVDVVVSSYVTLRLEKAVFKRREFKCLVLDEGHKIKSQKTQIREICDSISTRFTIILTGTPIQNNVEELWSLLKFLDPLKFTTFEDFLKGMGDLQSFESTFKLKEIMSPYVLHRKKIDILDSLPSIETRIVKVELLSNQKALYRAVFEQNQSVLLDTIKRRVGLDKLVFTLRQICNHPFLIDNVEDTLRRDIEGDPPTDSDEENKKEDEEAKKARKKNKRPYKKMTEQAELEFLISKSSKMILLDKLIEKILKQKQKCCIFSQMIDMLDILEDYCDLRGYKYERLDGSTQQQERQIKIDNFTNKEDVCIFLLSTKAGGLGINLIAANNVIIFDSDYNPFNDLQAAARCHRIGQKQKVTVYKLITNQTYEQHIMEVASLRLGFGSVLLEKKRNLETEEEELKFKEKTEKILRLGYYYMLKEDEKEAQQKDEQFRNQDIENILNNSKAFNYQGLKKDLQDKVKKKSTKKTRTKKVKKEETSTIGKKEEEKEKMEIDLTGEEKDNKDENKENEKKMEIEDENKEATKNFTTEEIIDLVKEKEKKEESSSTTENGKPKEIDQNATPKTPKSPNPEDDEGILEGEDEEEDSSSPEALGLEEDNIIFRLSQENDEKNNNNDKEQTSAPSTTITDSQPAVSGEGGATKNISEKEELSSLYFVPTGMNKEEAAMSIYSDDFWQKMLPEYVNVDELYNKVSSSDVHFATQEAEKFISNMEKIISEVQEQLMPSTDGKKNKRNQINLSVSSSSSSSSKGSSNFEYALDKRDTLINILQIIQKNRLAEFSTFADKMKLWQEFLSQRILRKKKAPTPDFSPSKNSIVAKQNGKLSLTEFGAESQDSPSNPSGVGSSNAETKKEKNKSKDREENDHEYQVFSESDEEDEFKDLVDEEEINGRKGKQKRANQQKKTVTKRLHKPKTAQETYAGAGNLQFINYNPSSEQKPGKKQKNRNLKQPNIGNNKNFGGQIVPPSFDNFLMDSDAKMTIANQIQNQILTSKMNNKQDPSLGSNQQQLARLSELSEEILEGNSLTPMIPAGIAQQQVPMNEAQFRLQKNEPTSYNNIPNANVKNRGSLTKQQQMMMVQQQHAMMMEPQNIQKRIHEQDLESLKNLQIVPLGADAIDGEIGSGEKESKLTIVSESSMKLFVAKQVALHKQKNPSNNKSG